MAVETVLLALLGVVAAWLAIDAGRERHRLRARMERATARTSRPPRETLGGHDRHEAGRRAVPSASGPASSPAADGWRYWPLTVATSEDGSIGPRL